jgi:two-component system, LytTR family, sensor kinase
MIIANKTLRRILFTYSVILLIATVTYLARWLSGQFSKEFNDILFFISLLLISISWEVLRKVHAGLNELLPFEKNIALRIAVQLVAGIALAFTIRFAIYKFGEPYLPFKLDSLFLASTWALYGLAVTGVNAVFFTKYFIGRWKDSLIRAERLEKEKSQVQFDNLKNQLNPHFLFNALTSLNSLITENPVLASQFLQQMSKVYRYVLQNKDRNFVSLQTELDFISNYVFLVETRFAGALKIQFTIPDSLKEKAIVPVTLQILIENALKHNVTDVHRPLHIDILTSGDYLVVSNNLQIKTKVETSNKQGLENLKSLYRFLTDEPVIIEQGEQLFSVKVPLL